MIDPEKQPEGEVVPFSPAFAQAEKEKSRRRHMDVTRGEFEDMQANVEKLARLLVKLSQAQVQTRTRQTQMATAVEGLGEVTKATAEMIHAVADDMADDRDDGLILPDRFRN